MKHSAHRTRPASPRPWGCDLASSRATPRPPGSAPFSHSSSQRTYVFDLTHDFSLWLAPGDQSTPLTPCATPCSSRMAGLVCLPALPTGWEFSKGERLRGLGSSVRHAAASTRPSPGPRDGADAVPQASRTLADFVLAAAPSRMHSGTVLWRAWCRQPENEPN